MKRNTYLDALHESRMARERLDAEDLRRRTTYGVFVWDGRGNYPAEAAIKVFKREAAAQKFADTGLDQNWVVRPIIAQKGV